MNIEGPYQLETYRDFVNDEYQPTKQCIQYDMDYKYTGIDDGQLRNLQLMPNLGAISVWYQKTHKPTWWTAWQALTQAVNLATTSNFLTRFYAYNAFFYVFYDKVLVKEGVLAGLSPTDQDIVYLDTFVGMDTTSKLTYWVAANIEGPGSPEWNYIVDYYADKGIDMSQAIYQVCGHSSIIQFVVQNEKALLLNYAPFNQKVVLNPLQMSQI